jgi:catechol 2,3-dioxygenase
MSSVSIHPGANVGYVHLTVTNLERSLKFYQDSMGFKVHALDAEQRTARLGAGRDDILALTELPAARRVRHTSGLYHFAVLRPSRLELARSLTRLSESGWRLDGASDHLVSEALYLSDPDGNGIEIYRDRPKSEWPVEDGQVRMAADPLDFDGILEELRQEAEPWPGLDPATVLGHMHLHVGDQTAAEAFYCGVIGFDLMQRWNGASFVSAGGYHHHLGFNTWAGVGAPPAPPDAVGLRYWTLRLPEATELERIRARARAAGVAFEETERGTLMQDPSMNGVLLTVAPSG